MEVHNKNQVRIDTRLNVLVTAVGEYAKAFGADDDCLNSIKKGIHERQIIEQVELRYYSKTKFVGKITMKIDWSLHQVLVNSEKGNIFRLSADKSVLEQLDAASQEIIKHVNRLKKACAVTKVDVTYRYRSEYRDDPQKHDEARKFLGHVPADISKEVSTDQFKTCIRFVMDKLKELELTVEN